MEEDLKQIDEDVMMHAMLGGFTHEDGRECMHHMRLNMWISITDSKHGSNSFRCLRSHDEWNRP